jgi:hypothetical protein
VFKYSSRFWLYAPTGLFLTLAIAVMIHWWLAAGAFEKNLAALKGHEAIPGVTLDWTGVRVGGFPFRLDADFTNFHVQGAGAHGPAAWVSEKFALHGLTYGRSQNVYEAAGRQQARWTDADGHPHAASFLPGSMRGSSILDAQGLKRFDLDIVDMAVSNLAFTRFQFHVRRASTGLDLMLKAEPLKSAADRKAAEFQVYASLNQADAWAALLGGDMSWPQADAQWRARGGKAGLSQLIAPEMSADLLLSPLY